MAKAARALVGPHRSWTPEEAARYDIAMCRGLSRDKKALRVYLSKVRTVATVRAQCQQQLDAAAGGCEKMIGKGAGGASAGSAGSSGPPAAAAAESRKRRGKSAAQRQQSVKKLQHKWLQRRCEAAAAKAGGSPPKVLARVLACCGRFLQLLHPEGAELMERVRQAEAVSEADAMDTGLCAMRAALAATETAAAAQPEAMDVGALTPATEPAGSRKTVALWEAGSPRQVGRGQGAAPQRPSPERLRSHLQMVKQRRDGQAAGATPPGPAG